MSNIWKPAAIVTTSVISENTIVILILLLQYASATPRAEKIPIHNNTPFVQEIIRLSKAAEMRTYMNESIDPCTNFYEFSCGNWPKLNPAFLTSSTGLFENLAKSLDRKIVGILGDKAEQLDTEVDKKVKDFYVSCTKFSKLNAYDTEISNDQLTKIMNEFGGMPAQRGSNWNADTFDWIETVAKIAHKYDKGIILSTNIMPDFAENTINRVYIQHPKFPLITRAMYVENSTAAFRDMWQMRIDSKLQKYLGIEPKTANQTSIEIVEFEAALAFGMVENTKGLEFGELSVRTTAAKLQEKFTPILNVEKLIRISLGEEVLVPIYEYAPEYQENLVKVINVTPKRIIANYIMYTLIEKFLVDGAQTPAEHKNKCIKKTKEYFAKNLDNMVYRRYNTKSSELDFFLIWHELKRTLKIELLSNKLQWITQNVRQLTIEKLDAMQLAINTYENVNFAEEFGDLNITTDDYITNVKNIYELSSRQKRKMLHEKSKSIESGVIFSFSPVNVVEENIVKLPVALLQPYFLWAESYPNAINYGGLGAVMAHEIIHGFDDSGRKYDKFGNQIDWWDEPSIKEFKNRTECFIDQYSNFWYNGAKLPRSESQTENIADNSGVRIAYQSYLRWLQRANSEQEQLETLHTMEYTNKQLFFISYAQVWCNDVNSFMRSAQLNVDTHMPGEFRVIGPLSNFPEFAKEFNCAKDTVMNPSKKCNIY